MEFCHGRGRSQGGGPKPLSICGTYP